MGQLRNRMRHFVDADGPLAPGLLVIGDAAYHSNPIYGRGCPSAMMQAALLDEAIGRHRDDPVAAACTLHALSESQVRPFWEAAVVSDRRLLGDRALPTGSLAMVVTLAEQAFGWFLERGILPATLVDPVVFRGILRVFHMLEAPEKLARDPEMLMRSLPILARVLLGSTPRKPFEPVRRADALARIGA
jgi:hypothetical protein